VVAVALSHCGELEATVIVFVEDSLACQRSQHAVERRRGRRSHLARYAGARFMDAARQARTLQRQIRDGRQHNLPAYRLPLIGRQHELDLLAPLVVGADNHVLTLTGAGGCGKTSLALELACRLLDEFADGVFLVELAALTEAALVSQAVATALGVPDKVDRPLVDALVNVLRDRSTLLVLALCHANPVGPTGFHALRVERTRGCDSLCAPGWSSAGLGARRRTRAIVTRRRDARSAR